jgi:hypothetical protein
MLTSAQGALGGIEVCFVDPVDLEMSILVLELELADQNLNSEGFLAFSVIWCLGLALYGGEAVPFEILILGEF